MKTLAYNYSSNNLRFIFPVSWDPRIADDVFISVIDRDGRYLVIDDGVTLYSDTVLAADAPRFADTIVLDDDADALAVDDLILIDGIEGFERHGVKGFDIATQTVLLTEITDRVFGLGDTVYGCFGDYVLDTTDTDDYPLGSEIRIIWKCLSKGLTVEEPYQVLDTVIEYPDFERLFEAIYPRAYDAFQKPKNRFKTVMREAENLCRIDLEGCNLLMDRIRKTSYLSNLIAARMAVLWTLSGDKDIEDEHERLSANYDRQFKALCKLPIWVDQNLDNIEDEEEITAHEIPFERRW
jgi:hypothetical protein